MSLESVRAFLRAHAPDIDIIETAESSSTVALAAEAHGVEPAQIAKTICLRVGEQMMLVVAGGTARLDNRKFKDTFGAKGRMLDAEEVAAVPAIRWAVSAPSACPRRCRSIAIFRYNASTKSSRRPARPIRPCASPQGGWRS
jgi:hypothetical protein